jgi:hypothetical protein
MVGEIASINNPDFKDPNEVTIILLVTEILYSTPLTLNDSDWYAAIANLAQKTNVNMEREEKVFFMIQ